MSVRMNKCEKEFPPFDKGGEGGFASVPFVLSVAAKSAESKDHRPQQA
jgi:hypothetical protein